MIKILFVEDDDFIREAVSQMIRDWGNEVFVASDVGEALEVLRSSENIDALITDINLKTATHGGYELSRRATEQQPSLRVLYTSGTARNQNHIYLAVRGSQFIQKPYREDCLRNAIETLLAVSV